MITQRKLKSGKGYRVTFRGQNSSITKTFGFGRAEEYAKARFIEEHRDDRNFKPFRTRAQKALARTRAIKINGTHYSDVGYHHHAGA